MKHLFMAAFCLIIGCVLSTEVFAEKSKEEAEKEPLFVQSDLTRRGGEDIEDGVRRVETQDGASGVATGSKAVSGGSSYVLTFEARGNHNLTVMVSGEGVKRIDPFKSWQPLTNDWKKFKANVKFPASAQDANFFFFYWNQPGKWFEIRNFKVVPR